MINISGKIILNVGLSKGKNNMLSGLVAFKNKQINKQTKKHPFLKDVVSNLIGSMILVSLCIDRIFIRLIKVT